MYYDLASCCVGVKSEETSAPQSLEIDNPWLGQNIPNPFDQSTIIQFCVPENVQQAEIRVYDMNGREIKKYTLENGYGEINFDGNQQPSGSYIYTFINDGDVIATKKMVLNN